MCFVDIDPAEVFIERERKARKEHSCQCCHATIKKGETYTSVFMVIDGSVSDEAICDPCNTSRGLFAKEHGSSSNPSYFSVLLKECIDDSEESREVWKPHLDEMKSRWEVEKAARAAKVI